MEHKIELVIGEYETGGFKWSIYRNNTLYTKNEDVCVTLGDAKSECLYELNEMMGADIDGNTDDERQQDGYRIEWVIANI